MRPPRLRLRRLVVTPAELHTALREVVAIGRRGGYDNDEIAANLARVVRAHSRDAVLEVLNDARDVVEQETGDYPGASPAVTSGIWGGFDQWAMGRIAELGDCDPGSAWPERDQSAGADCPNDCACHSYMPPGRVCSWCQQEGHEDS